jgi:hypothetical protein
MVVGYSVGNNVVGDAVGAVVGALHCAIQPLHLPLAQSWSLRQ